MPELEKDINYSKKDMDLESSFIHILSHGRKDNTYKFALAKFILDFIKEQTTLSDIKIEYSLIAEYFLKYYWFQECKYKLKQDFKKNKPPRVITIIRNYCGEEYISQSYKNYFKDKNKLKVEIINRIEKECLSNVIPRFQNSLDFPFYKHFHEKNLKGNKYILPRKEKRYIFIDKKPFSYIKENYELLNKLVILEWAKFLEKTNFTPNLISKIESFGKSKRKSLSKFRKILNEIDNKCFYCDSKLEEKNAHVDHFIPWSYIFEDNEWNFVLSCNDCNLKKSDLLANEQYLEKIIRRNKIKGFEEINKDISVIYENCKKAGFRVLS